MILIVFFVDKLIQVLFFEEIFLVADNSIEIILRMFFFSLSNADVHFAEIEKLICQNHIAETTLLITKTFEHINKRQFAVAILDKNAETFGVLIAAWLATSIHLSKIA